MVHLKILESVLDYTPSPPPHSAPEPVVEAASKTTETGEDNGKSEKETKTAEEVVGESGKGDVEMSEVDETSIVKKGGSAASSARQGEKLVDTEQTKSTPTATTSTLPDDPTLLASSSASTTPRARPTLVIATGDANSSEYNPGGFLGCVRRALDRGWDVEIASFSTHGLSSLWIGEKAKRLTEDGKPRGELRIVNLETFAEELVL